MAPILDNPVDVASELLACVCAAFAASDRPVCRCSFALGDPPPVDVCEPCTVDGQGGHGQAWVRVGPIFPTAPFPQPEAVAQACGPSSFLAVEYTVGAYRCAPVIGAKGQSPSVESLAAAVIGQGQDRAIISGAIRCCIAAGVESDDDPVWLLGTWTPIEPGGGYFGGSMTVTVALRDCWQC